MGSRTTDDVPGRSLHELAGPASVSGLRGLVLVWCVWLLVSWVLILSADLVAPAAPAVDRMVFAAMVGLLMAWPALRLSQSGCGPAAVGVTLAEWWALNLVFQTVVWPLSLIGRWSLSQTLWLDAAVASWSLLTALVIGCGRLVSGGGRRTVAMLVCVAVVFGDAVWAMAGGAGGGLRWSPIASVWVLTARPQRYEPGEASLVVLSVAAAAVVGWVLLAGWCWWAGASRARRRLW